MIVEPPHGIYEGCNAAETWQMHMHMRDNAATGEMMRRHIRHALIMWLADNLEIGAKLVKILGYSLEYQSDMYYGNLKACRLRRHDEILEEIELPSYTAMILMKQQQDKP